MYLSPQGLKHIHCFMSYKARKYKCREWDQKNKQNKITVLLRLRFFCTTSCLQEAVIHYKWYVLYTVHFP